jgi:hypothetical protein
MLIGKLGEIPPGVSGIANLRCSESHIQNQTPRFEKKCGSINQ